MAKKKTSVFRQTMTTPMNLGHVIIGVFAAVVMTSINIQMVQKTAPVPSQKSANKVVITQNDLMNVLGTSISLGETQTVQDGITQLMKDPVGKYWYDVLASHADYRDAHLMVATLAYNKHQCAIAQSQLATVLTIDPNIAGIERLKNAIIECGK